MKLKQYVIAGVVGFYTVLAGAANPLHQAQAEQEQQADQFVTQAGYGPLDPEQLSSEAYYNSGYFSQTAQTASVFLPDANLDAVTRALLLFEHHEKELPHARYVVQFSTEHHTEVPELQQSYVEVTRYNLGPARRADLLQYLPADQVAPISDFGQGPHVSWRLAMGPLMGMQADIRAASRKEIDQGTAQKAMCFDQPCLSLASAMPPEGKERVLAAPSLPAPTYKAQSEMGTSHVARVAQELFAILIPEQADPMPMLPDQPQFQAVLSMNVDGQEANTLGLVHQTMVMDDAIGQIWLVRQEVAGIEAEFIETAIPRRRGAQ